MGEWGRVGMSICLSGSPFARNIAVQCKINIFLLQPSLHVSRNTAPLPVIHWVRFLFRCGRPNWLMQQT